jgi:hypothetical protein
MSTIYDGGVMDIAIFVVAGLIGCLPVAIVGTGIAALACFVMDKMTTRLGLGPRIKKFLGGLSIYASLFFFMAVALSYELAGLFHPFLLDFLHGAWAIVRDLAGGG